MPEPDLCASQVMKTYHMYHTESISAESKLKEFEKQEERQIGRTGDPVFNVRLEDKTPRRSFVKKIEKMKEKVLNNTLNDFCRFFSSGYSWHMFFLENHITILIFKDLEKCIDLTSAV